MILQYKHDKVSAGIAWVARIKKWFVYLFGHYSEPFFSTKISR